MIWIICPLIKPPFSEARRAQVEDPSSPEPDENKSFLEDPMTESHELMMVRRCLLVKKD